MKPLLLRRIASGLACAGLAACTGTLLPRPPAAPVRHVLDVPGAAAARTVAPAAGAPVLVVDTPRAAPGLDSTRLLYTRGPQALQAYAFHEWVEPPAQLLAPLLVRALQDTGAFRAVLRAPTAGAGGWRLETELLRLQQDFTTPPSRLRLTLRAVLVDSATRQVVAWREFDVAPPAPSEDADGGVAAAQQAVQALLPAVAAFCAAQAAR